MAAKTVQIGDTTHTIGRFSTFKALRAGKLLTEILKALPGLSKEMTDFAAEYREKNVTRMNRATAELRFPPEDLANISEEAWQSSGGYLELPAAPGPVEIAAHVFPRIFEETNERLLTLLALVVVPNSKLREADTGDGVDVAQMLTEERRMLEHSDLDELVDLMAVAADVIEEQFAGKAEVLRKALGAFGIQFQGPDSTSSTTTPTPSTPPTPTDSDGPTDGPETNHSTESLSDKSPISSTP